MGFRLSFQSTEQASVGQRLLHLPANLGNLCSLEVAAPTADHREILPLP